MTIDIAAYLAVLFLILFCLLLLIVAACKAAGRKGKNEEEAIRRAGRRGEEIATGVIQSVLRPGDIMLRNVPMRAFGQRTELDNVIVNPNGVFIIEVKNYSGTLTGSEGDDQWTKSKRTRDGVLHQKTVRNPIRQMEREVYITGNYLSAGKCGVSPQGFAYLVQHNSPVASARILQSRADIDRAIHTVRPTRLSQTDMDRIVTLLQQAPAC